MVSGSGCVWLVRGLLCVLRVGVAFWVVAVGVVIIGSWFGICVAIDFADGVCACG